MPKAGQQRSPGRALELAIRVFGTDFQGREFVEDAETSVVSRHGAMVRLKRKLIPEQEIRILCQGNNREAVFRVVCQAGEATNEFSFWEVECLNPEENIWEGARPRPRPKLGPTLDPQVNPTQSSNDRPPGQVTLRCSNCGMRELIDLDQTQVQAIHKLKGLVRGCPACGATGLWKRVAVR